MDGLDGQCRLARICQLMSPLTHKTLEIRRRRGRFRCIRLRGLRKLKGNGFRKDLEVHAAKDPRLLFSVNVRRRDLSSPVWLPQSLQAESSSHRS